MNADRPDPATRREWNTAGAPAGERLALWREAMAEAFVPVAVQAPEPDRFVSGVTVRTVGRLDIAEIAAPAQSAFRTPALVRQTVGDVYFLNLPLSPGASLRQDGRSAQLTPGDFAVVDGDRPFDLHFATRFAQVSMTLPREMVDARLARPADVTAVRIAGDRGLGAVAGAAIRAAAVSASTIDRRSSRALGERLGDLIALALGGVRPQSIDAPQTLLMQGLLDEVERALGDPELSPARVAERLGISVRYLHRLFADHGPSFGRWVSARRLSLAHDDLLDPARAGWTVARIAHERGFADPSYFTRMFKLRYGVTPHKLRTAVGR